MLAMRAPCPGSSASFDEGFAEGGAPLSHRDAGFRGGADGRDTAELHAFDVALRVVGDGAEIGAEAGADALVFRGLHGDVVRGGIGGGDAAGDEAHEFGDLGSIDVVDLVGGVAGHVVVGVGAGEGVQRGDAFQIERGAVRRQMGVVLRRDRQTDGRIAFFDLLRPQRAAAEALEHQRLLETADHVHVQARGEHAVELRVGVAFDHLGVGLDKVIAAEQTEFLATPRGEDDVAFQREFALLLQIGQPLGDFEHAADAGGIVIGSVMDFVHLIAFGA